MTLRALRLFLCGLLCSLSLHAEELTVFAAASLSDALKELAPAFEAQAGDKLRFNFGGSSTLARQIKEGAPADVFFSADEAKMDSLDSAGLIAPHSRKTLLSNSLVIVVAKADGPTLVSAADLAKKGVRRLALGETKTVPAGIYAREYLSRCGLWETLAPKVVPLDNVRTALSAVEAGNAQAAIVYKTDALISDRVRVAVAIPPADGPNISYPVAIIATSNKKDAAARFVAFLQTSAAQAVFERHGFMTAR